MLKNSMKKIEKFESIFGEDFSNEEETTNGIEKLKIEELIAFKNHPFKLYTGERLNEMVLRHVAI
jgi:ParB family chromosome partitioning protein